jgi:hypothetical protein
VDNTTWYLIFANSWLFLGSTLKVTNEKVDIKINKDKQKSRIIKEEKESGKEGGQYWRKEHR